MNEIPVVVDVETPVLTDVNSECGWVFFLFVSFYCVAAIGLYGLNTTDIPTVRYNITKHKRRTADSVEMQTKRMSKLHVRRQ